MASKNFNMNITETLGYEEMLKRVTFKKVSENNWNTFFRSGGRIVENDSYYYCLSPKHPEAIKRNPKIMLIL